MKTYDPQTLRKVQDIELMILKEFDTFCHNHHIDYALVGGSALGAKRHGGFIPWDDDIDVMMNRKDYDQFLKLAEKELSDKYFILDYDHNHNYPSMNAHLCLKGTKFVPDDARELKDAGIFLDLFCFDNIPEEQKQMEYQAKHAWFWGKLMILIKVKEPTLYYYGFKRKVLRFILKLAYCFFKIIRLSTEKCYKKACHYRDLYRKEETKRFSFMFDPSLYTSILNKDDVYPTRRMNFNGIQVNVPHKIETYLETRYGDYMTLPPKEKQHNHLPYILDFGPYKDYIFEERQ